MKLSGHLTLQIVNELTGEIVQTIEQDNIITDIAYKSEALVERCYWEANRIFISNETATPIRTKTSIQCLGTAYQGSGQPGITPFQNADPPYFVITQRLDSLASPRTFQTVGLTTENPGQNVNTTVTPYAYLLLNQPCTQETNQILNLIYRITINNTVIVGANKPLYPRWINDICYDLTQSNNNLTTILTNYFFTTGRAYYPTTCSSPLKEYNWKYLYLGNVYTLVSLRSSDSSFFNTIDAANQRNLFYRLKQYINLLRSNNEPNNNGRMINGMLAGLNGLQRSGDPGITNSAHSSSNVQFTSNLQSAFSYSSSPRDDLGPMFLPDNNSSGTGRLQFSEDPWTGTWPTIYRVKITTGGSIGTAKYVLGVKQFTSFASDASFTYANCTRSYHPYIYAFTQPYDKCHGWQLTMPIVAIDDKWTVQADWNGVSIINQFTGQHYDFDTTTTPALPITNFRQLAIDATGNFIYVACSATGLWRLNITNKAAVVITNLSTTPCYAVDVSSAGVIYAFMNVASTDLILTSSASSYVTDLGFTGLTTADYLNLYINRLHADTRAAITVRTSNVNSTLRSSTIYWWSLAGGSSANNYITNIPHCGENQTSFAWVKGSDNRFWAANGSLFAFDSSTMINNAVGKMTPEGVTTFQDGFLDPNTYKLLDNTFSTNVAPISVCQDVWGYLIPLSSGQEIYKPSDGTTQFTYNNGQTVSSQTNVTKSFKKVTLTNGITLSDTAAYYIYNNGMNNDINKWIWYKWDGSNWIKAVTYNADTDVWTDTTSTSTKTTSTSFLPLLDGINVKFFNGTSEPSFVVGEVYDQYVGKGILKTNDNSIYIESCPFYTQPVFSNVTLSSSTITSANSYGVVLNGAPGDSGISSAVSAITVNPLWHSVIPEYTTDNMKFFINGVEITRCFSETIDTLPLQSALTIGQIILYRNGLIICSTADDTKTLTGYFSYVARSD